MRPDCLYPIRAQGSRQSQFLKGLNQRLARLPRTSSFLRPLVDHVLRFSLEMFEDFSVRFPEAGRRDVDPETLLISAFAIEVPEPRNVEDRIFPLFVSRQRRRGNGENIKGTRLTSCSAAALRVA